MADIVAGNFFPATLGEQLPNTTRTLIMNVTAHDNRPSGGGITNDTMSLTGRLPSGPFAVTVPNGGETWDLALPQIVNWIVAGTAAPPVSAANVDILLSLDGGSTYPSILVANTPNDGSQVVNLSCAMRSTTCRVMVRASSTPHYFFDISNASFRVADLTPPVVTPTLARSVFAPPRGSMLPPGSPRPSPTAATRWGP